MKIKNEIIFIENVSLILFLILLFSLMYPNVFAKNIAIFVLTNGTNSIINITPTDAEIFVPSNEKLSKYSLRIYDAFEQEQLRIDFNNFTFLILPYDLTQFKTLKIFYTYYEIAEKSLEMCNHNNICENNEIDCDDCQVSKRLLELVSNEEIMKKSSNNGLIIFLIIMTFLIMIVLFIVNKLQSSLKEEQNSQNISYEQNYFNNYQLTETPYQNPYQR